MKMQKIWAGVALAAAVVFGSTVQAEHPYGLEEGALKLSSPGPLAFGPDGILFVGDPKAATVYAVDTKDNAQTPMVVQIKIEDVASKVAETIGGTSADVMIDDVAVNPKSGNTYLAVHSQSKPEVSLLKVDTNGSISKVDMEKIAYSKLELPNAPEDKVSGEGRRQRNPRMESITDIAFMQGRLLVSGLSNAKSASSVRELAFPFSDSAESSSVEIFHGAHGRAEDNSAIRTFVPFMIEGKPSLLAGYTCTPLVRFPVEALEDGKKVRGTTVAELGNWNSPIDMIVYDKEGATYLLLANTARGVMKISTKDIARAEGIENKIDGTAGQEFETVEALKGVIQLDKFNDKYAVVLVKSESGALTLQTVILP